MSTKLGIAAVVTLLFAAHAPNVIAQDGPAKPEFGAFALSAIQTRPVGALGNNIGFGYGIGGTFLLPLDRAGVLSLRADIGVSQYGYDNKRSAFSETVGGRVEVDVRTSNILETGSVGMQLTLPAGPIRPYVNSGAGVLFFVTESSVEPTNESLAWVSTVNQSDVALGWTVGGGIYVPVKKRLANAMLDIGVQYVRGGHAQYLAPGSIIDLDNGAIDIAPMESSTHLLALRLGVRIER